MPAKDIRSYSKDCGVTLSFVYHYFLNIVKKKIKRLIIYMDNCKATNKNNYLFMFLNYMVHVIK